jgi:hypothetical protein
LRIEYGLAEQEGRFDQDHIGDDFDGQAAAIGQRPHAPAARPPYPENFEIPERRADQHAANREGEEIERAGVQIADTVQVKTDGNAEQSGRQGQPDIKFHALCRGGRQVHLGAAFGANFCCDPFITYRLLFPWPPIPSAAHQIVTQCVLNLEPLCSK